MLIALVQLVPGLAILFVGGHYLVQGAAGIALLARIPTAVVALTVVAMGTSLPELAVSLDAAAQGATDLAYGNIVGSCVFNIGGILAVAALLGPIAVRRTTNWIEYAIMFFVTAMVLVLARDRWIDRLDGGFLMVSLVLFLVYTVYLARKGVTLSQAAELQREVERTAHIESGLGLAWGRNVAFVVGGIAALVVGAELSVAGGVTAARLLNVEERVIGLTVIAMGTSLPELATSVVAARRGEQEIALGNIIGSNIFNLLAILGITASIFPVPVNERAANLDNWVVLGFTLALFPMMLTGRRISRANALLLLAGFATYMTYLVLVS